MATSNFLHIRRPLSFTALAIIPIFRDPREKQSVGIIAIHDAPYGMSDPRSTVVFHLRPPLQMPVRQENLSTYQKVLCPYRQLLDIYLMRQ